MARNILTDLLKRLERSKTTPSRLLRHPYFCAMDEKRWGGVTSWGRPQAIRRLRFKTKA